MSDKLIPLGKIVRQHGLVRGGAAKFKIQLYNPGGALFKERRLVHVSTSVEARDFRTLELMSNPSPLQGSWGHAPAIIIEVPEAANLKIGGELALPREAFAPLGESEFYVCDLLGHQILDEEGASFGVVHSFHDVAPTLGGSVNLVGLDAGGKSYEFPFAWADLEASKAKGDGVLVVPGIAQWKSIR